VEGLIHVHHKTNLPLLHLECYQSVWIENDLDLHDTIKKTIREMDTLHMAKTNQLNCRKWNSVQWPIQKSYSVMAVKTIRQGTYWLQQSGSWVGNTFCRQRKCTAVVIRWERRSALMCSCLKATCSGTLHLVQLSTILTIQILQSQETDTVIFLTQAASICLHEKLSRWNHINIM